jgi:hypothetical protein
MSTGMFTFQGDYRRRTPVNLGRTKHEDNTTLLKRDLEKRRAREENRRREYAAMKIQVFLRSFMLLARADSRHSGEGAGKSVSLRMVFGMNGICWSRKRAGMEMRRRGSGQLDYFRCFTTGSMMRSGQYIYSDGWCIRTKRSTTG